MRDAQTYQQEPPPTPASPPQGGREKVKIGHAGTLDPLASGVLPLALGEATKTIPYMMDTAKAYVFTVAWGAETETDDLEGKIMQVSDKRPSAEEILAILPRFTGEIEQVPPAYSAIHVDGKRAYELARGGEVVELKARRVRVDTLAVIPAKAGINASAGVIGEMDPGFRRDDMTFLCHCGKGTYIRSLARDMGRALGCLGHVSMLRRIKVGKFDENHAISLAKLEEMVHKGDLGFLQKVASALDDIPAVSVTANQADALRRGQAVSLWVTDGQGTVAAFCEGELIAIVDAMGGVVKPRRVFNL